MKTAIKTKTLVLSTLMTLSYAQKSVATETMVITAHPKYGISLGFADTSFNYPQSLEGQALKKELDKVKFCYVGNVKEVCAHIKSQVFEMNARYSGGAHDRLDLYSCNQSAGSSSWDWDRDNYSVESINVNYRLIDDYGSNFVVERDISPCPKS